MSAPTEPEDQVVVIDDRTTFEALYPMLRRYAAAIAAAETDPDDLVQDALVRVLSAGGFARIEHPEAYLRRTIVNLASNGRRGLARQRKAVGRLAGARDLDVVPEYPSELSALLRLTPSERAVLYLADVERLSFDEIGKILDIRVATARGRASRARKALRAHLEAGDEANGHR